MGDQLLSAIKRLLPWWVPAALSVVFMSMTGLRAWGVYPGPTPSLSTILVDLGLAWALLGGSYLYYRLELVEIRAVLPAR